MLLRRKPEVPQPVPETDEQYWARLRKSRLEAEKIAEAARAKAALLTPPRNLHTRAHQETQRPERPVRGDGYEFASAYSAAYILAVGIVEDLGSKPAPVLGDKNKTVTHSRQVRASDGRTTHTTTVYGTVCSDGETFVPRRVEVRSESPDSLYDFELSASGLADPTGGSADDGHTDDIFASYCQALVDLDRAIAES